MRGFNKWVGLVLIAILVAAVAVVAGEKPWFDMEHCAMCKNMTPELMKNTTWAHYDISKGIVCVTTVPEKLVPEYRKAHKGMEATAQRLMNGEQLEVCGSCTALGACMMKGVSEDYVATPNGDIWILTSDNPEVVADLHAWVKRNNEEMAKMAKMKEE